MGFSSLSKDIYVILSILRYLGWGLSLTNLLRYPTFKLGYLYYNKDPSIREYILEMLLIHG